MTIPRWDDANMVQKMTIYSAGAVGDWLGSLWQTLNQDKTADCGERGSAEEVRNAAPLLR
jgi:hypothetical protein